MSSDTPHFAVDNLAKWWAYDGRRRYPGATELLILADGGGSNGPRNRAWKVALQEQLCDRHGLRVTVCHYPTGASKWNPIEKKELVGNFKNGGTAWNREPVRVNDHDFRSDALGIGRRTARRGRTPRSGRASCG